MSEKGPQQYKRSQVEQAIVAIERVGGLPVTAIRANIKRLLDGDRKPPAKRLDWQQEEFAFYDSKGPGQGAEIAYTPYHAFALLIGVRLLAGGIPQSRILLLLRRLRTELESAFQILTRQDLRLVRPDVRSEASLAHLVEDGFLLQDAPSMTFLIVQAGPAAKPIPQPDDGFAAGNVCSFSELAQRLVFFSHAKQTAVVVELANAVHQLMVTLPRMTVRKRGRP